MNKFVLSASFPLVFLLSVSVAHADVCTAPGDIVLEDATGDSLIGLPTGDFYDLVALSVAAPAAVNDEERKLIFTIDLSAQQPLPVMLPGSAIYASFVDPRQQVRGVRVQADSMGAMQFFSYLAGPSSSTAGPPVTDGRFVEEGSEVPAQPESSYSGGVVTIVVKFKDIRLDEDGGTIVGFNAGTPQAATVPGVGGLAFVMDEMPDGLVHTNVLEIPKCGGKSTDVKAAATDDKSGTNFGGAFGLLNLCLMLPLALFRRRI